MASLVIPIENESDIILARQSAREMARSMGFNPVDECCLVTSVSELATNIFFYAGRGKIMINQLTRDGVQGIEIVAEDQGPGIVDLDLALTDGYSTSNGLGGGLPGVQRLMSQMEINSVVGQGTTVRAVKWPRVYSENQALIARRA